MTAGSPGTAGKPDGAGDGVGGGDGDGAGIAEGGASAEAAAAAAADAPASVPGGPAVTDAAAEVPAGSAGTGWKRPAPTLTTDTARPEGGGRAAPGDAPAPARQWPLLTVLTLAGIGLLVVGTDPFPQAFRIGAMLVGAALLVGAVMRRALPSVGMLAVRSRFTDMITYGVMGGLIVLLALMVQPKPWLTIPFLEEVLHLTVT
ncbi:MULTISPECIES: DUF3017 domain-containing protein [Streptomyces]|nr:DUF3017 domain-containing protein [Streptomyces venezuelae]APE23465.1 hypothetical protein vnz_22220 [Streptomyces venezuelae]QES00839.1 DUF3017 domain-containing protein [Streptomyces venezuelae ATCC 10712]